MSQELLKQAQRLFAIQDVYICDIKAHCQTDFEPRVPIEPLGIQTRISQNQEAQYYCLASGNNRGHFLKYFIETGLRVLRPGIDAAGPVADDQVLAEIVITFIATYVIKNEEAPSEQLVNAFADNAIHHIWPYWREYVHSTMIRFRLPPVMLPMRIAGRPKPGQGEQIAATAIDSQQQ